MTPNISRMRSCRRAARSSGGTRLLRLKLTGRARPPSGQLTFGASAAENSRKRSTSSMSAFLRSLWRRAADTNPWLVTHQSRLSSHKRLSWPPSQDCERDEWLDVDCLNTTRLFPATDAQLAPQTPGNVEGDARYSLTREVALHSRHRTSSGGRPNARENQELDHGWSPISRPR